MNNLAGLKQIFAGDDPNSPGLKMSLEGLQHAGKGSNLLGGLGGVTDPTVPYNPRGFDPSGGQDINDWWMSVLLGREDAYNQGVESGDLPGAGAGGRPGSPDIDYGPEDPGPASGVDYVKLAGLQRLPIGGVGNPFGGLGASKRELNQAATGGTYVPDDVWNDLTAEEQGLLDLMGKSGSGGGGWETGPWS